MTTDNSVSELPESLLEAVAYFSDPARCHDLLVSMRWAGVPVCSKCGAKEVGFLAKQRRYKCRKCRVFFSAKQGTIFEDSPISLRKWFIAIWLVTNAKNGISSCELGRALAVTQKTAWFMLQRVRLAFHVGSFDKKLCGIVEVDETYIGGKARNMHKDKREERIKGRGTTGKVIVMGLLERKGEVRAQVIGNIKRKTLQDQIASHVEPGSEVHSDQLASYRGLDPEYVHNVINHAERYVEGHVYTNGVENFWSLLKRTIKGTYTSCEPFHLFRYLDEQTFRYNNRRETDGGRFVRVMGTVAGRRLAYKDLIGEKTEKRPGRKR